MKIQVIVSFLALFLNNYKNVQNSVAAQSIKYLCKDYVIKEPVALTFLETQYADRPLQSIEFCLTEHGDPVTATCQFDKKNEEYSWSKPSGDCYYSYLDNSEQGQLTQELDTFRTEEFEDDAVLESLIDRKINMTSFRPIDVHIFSQVLDRTTFSNIDFESVTFWSDIMDIPNDVLDKSEELFQSKSKIMQIMFNHENSFMFHDYERRPVEENYNPKNIDVLTIDIQKVKGIVLLKPRLIKLVYKNESIEDALDKDNVILAAFLSDATKGIDNESIKSVVLMLFHQSSWFNFPDGVVAKVPTIFTSSTNSRLSYGQQYYMMTLYNRFQNDEYIDKTSCTTFNWYREFQYFTEPTKFFDINSKYISCDDISENWRDFRTIAEVKKHCPPTQLTVGDVRLTFNASNINSVSTKSNEVCLTEDGQRIYLECLQNDTWSSPFGLCNYSYKNITIINQINLSSRIRDIADLKNRTDKLIKFNNLINQNKDLLTALDVSIMSEYINYLSEYDEMDIQFLSNFMDIPNNVLDDIINSSNWKHSLLQQFQHSNHNYHTFTSRNILVYSDRDTNVNILYKHNNAIIPAEITLRTALDQHPEFLVTFDTMYDHYNVTLVVLYNQILFRDSYDRRITVPVILLKLEQLENLFEREGLNNQTEVTFYYRRSYNRDDSLCSVWDNSWRIQSKSYVYKPNQKYFACKYKSFPPNYSYYFGAIKFLDNDNDSSESEANLTEELDQLLQSENSAELNQNLTIFVDENINNLLPHHIEVIAQIIDKPKVNSTTTIKTISTLLNAKPEVLHDSANNILRILDHKLDTNAKVLQRVTTDNLALDYFDISTNRNNKRKQTSIENICGIAYQSNAEFINLYCDQTIDNIINQGQIIVAIQFTKVLVDRIKETSAERIIVTIFQKDTLFNDPKAWITEASRAIGILIPEYNRQLPEPFYLMFRRSYFQAEATCSYWNFQDGWIDESDTTIKSESGSCSDYHVCKFLHVTHFGMVITDNIRFADAMETALEVLTAICSFLSLVGLFAIFLTAVLYRNWFNQSSTKILLNISVTISLQLVLFYVATLHKVGNIDCKSCLAMGSILHYIILSGFCWMLVLSYLNYRTYVIVLVGSTPSHLVMKASLFAWLVPLVPVLSLLLADSGSYIRNGNLAMCYPSGLGFYLAVILPLAIVLVLNAIVSAFIVKSLYYRPINRSATQNGQLAQMKIKLMIALFFNLGLTWIFGLFAAVFKWLLFMFLFCITAASHGFVLFLFSIVFNKDVKSFYRKKLKTNASSSYSASPKTSSQ